MSKENIWITLDVISIQESTLLNRYCIFSFINLYESYLKKLSKPNTYSDNLNYITVTVNDYKLQYTAHDNNATPMVLYKPLQPLFPIPGWRLTWVHEVTPHAQPSSSRPGLLSRWHGRSTADHLRLSPLLLYNPMPFLGDVKL